MHGYNFVFSCVSETHIIIFQNDNATTKVKILIHQEKQSQKLEIFIFFLITNTQISISIYSEILIIRFLTHLIITGELTIEMFNQVVKKSRLELREIQTKLPLTFMIIIHKEKQVISTKLPGHKQQIVRNNVILSINHSFKSVT